MQFSLFSSPHLHQKNGVSQLMFQVILALLPGIAAYSWYFGYGVLINIALAVTTALASEALMLRARGQPLGLFLTDGSAVVTAVLLALCLPPLAPWWVPVIGAAFALIFAKHLYGGLGYNPFNPAMVGYVLLLISFPKEMTAWLPARELATHTVGLQESLELVFTGATAVQGMTIDALSGATPLDYAKTQLGLGQPMAEIRVQPLFGIVGGQGWEWINAGFLLGGLWLLYKRVISWHIPLAMLGSLLILALCFQWLNPAGYPSALFHLVSGGVLLGAFFIATDPVTAAATPRGRLFYGAGVGCLTYIIRTWGGYPDGVAFAVLLMNMTVPLIDYYTPPRVFGHNRH
ncbi:Electron transport complex, RnfABCDGE type, D subunit [Nitrosococcus oceani ATCC 19707]|uniref:Ion-translocating oxidoreductase complex subunit D n=2 Tax=Nitrosococcus oceani TaxID=1229 RepID=Q3JBX1_NITOC|nr:electron transport complex subunit RsxD [Nitrosococcus oceani]ABA57675.1 Electron transport complex, RnfABCDGE type, D subunit [Nitrosococcus oceani ATCC 19707]EDZ68502.1 electron transport complex, RnfABCDGE type, D subunit subfamily [Nitrosococcus oceani AFC27]KFI19963.1 electron transporter RnfD [Nitrosococcus oceani C-27]